MKVRLHLAGRSYLLLWVTSMVLISAVVGLPKVYAQDELQVTVSTVNDGEYTIITGVVIDSNHNPVEGAKVSIQVNDPSGKTIHMELTYSDENGGFMDKFKTPEDVKGECTIYVSASKPGYENGSTTSSFTAIPEFSNALLVTAIPLIITLKMLKKRNPE